MKGKVERGVGYLKTSFLEGRSFIDLEDLNRQLAAWLDTVANVRVHGTTRERPVDRHVHELVKLGALIAVPQYDTRALEIRRVAPDSHFSFGGVLYSVFPEAAGKTVTLRIESEQVGAPVAVYLGEQLVARHTLAPKGSPRVTLPEHAAAIRRLTRGNAPSVSRRRGRQPCFVQCSAPEVEARAFDPYERIALESAA